MTTTDRLLGINPSVAYKVPCRVATTANITLSGLQTIDGVTLVDQDRVLVKDQTNAVENGIYVVDASTWTRAEDANSSRDMAKGTQVYVTEGDTFTNTVFYQSVSSPSVGSTSLNFLESNFFDATIKSVDDYDTGGMTDSQMIAAAYADLNAGNIGILNFQRRTYTLSEMPPVITQSNCIINFNKALLRFALFVTESSFVRLGDGVTRPTKVLLTGARFDCSLNEVLSSTGPAFLFQDCSDVRVHDFDVNKVPAVARFGKDGGRATRVTMYRGAGTFNASKDEDIYLFDDCAVITLDTVQITGAAGAVHNGKVFNFSPTNTLDTVRVQNCANYGSDASDYGIYIDTTNGACTNLWFENTTVDRCRLATVYATNAGTATSWARHITFKRCFFRSVGGWLFDLSNTGAPAGSATINLEKFIFEGCMLAVAGRGFMRATNTGSADTSEVSFLGNHMNEDLVYVDDITQATSAVVTFTSGHGFQVGEFITLNGVSGMTEVNGNSYEVTAVTDYTATLNVNSTGFSAYTSGGAASLTGTDAMEVGIEGVILANNTFGIRVPDAVAQFTHAVKLTAAVSELAIVGNKMGGLTTPLNLNGQTRGAKTAIAGNTDGGAVEPEKLHVGPAQIIAPNAAADELVIQGTSTSEAGLSILTNAAATGNIFFGDGTNAAVGRIRYDHTTDTFSIWTDGTARIALDATGLQVTALRDQNDAQVVGTQQAAIADSVGADEVAKINAILAALRAHGLIAT